VNCNGTTRSQNYFDYCWWVVKMIGAIAGHIIESIYERRPTKNEDYSNLFLTCKEISDIFKKSQAVSLSTILIQSHAMTLIP
jgi:hypothetical protein